MALNEIFKSNLALLHNIQLFIHNSIFIMVLQNPSNPYTMILKHTMAYNNLYMQFLCALSEDQDHVTYKFSLLNRLWALDTI